MMGCFWLFFLPPRLKDRGHHSLSFGDTAVETSALRTGIALCVYSSVFCFFFYFHTDPNPDFRGSGVRFRSGSGSGLDTGRVRKYLILAKIAASGVFIVFSNFTPNTTSSQSLRTGVRVTGLGEGRLQLEFTVFSNCMPTLTTSQRVKVRRMKVGGIFYFTLNSYIWCLLFFLNLY